MVVPSVSVLRRYWFNFEKPVEPAALRLGCGVTAFDYDDAVRLLRERVFGGRHVPKVTFQT